MHFHPRIFQQANVAQVLLQFTYRCFWVVFIGIISLGCEPETGISTDEARYKIGDNPQWASPDLNDDDWAHAPILALPDDPGPLWVRLDLTIPSTETLGLSVAGVAAREVYWDGVFIGQSGQVGTNFETEQAGPIDKTFRIPDSLSSSGTHTVALRVSSYRRPPSTSGLRMQFIAGEYAMLKTSSLRSIGLPLLFLGGFVIVAIYYSVLYIADRRRLPYLLTTLLCLFVAALLVAESWRNAIGYSYDLHTVRLGIIEALTMGVGTLLVATFAVQFDLPQRWLWLAGLAVLSSAMLLWIQDHETGTYFVFATSLFLALGITGWAVWKKQAGAWLALTGVAICLVVLLVARFDFMDRGFFPAFGALIAGLLTSVGLQTRAQRKRHAVALATAARLEAELLKKHLQPHFLMNTLTSVLELVETDPTKGARAIESLASELRALTDVSGEKLVPMDRELALCRAHLEVMGYRHAVTFALETSGVDKQGLIPPAIIHTLIENAITHNAYVDDTTFILQETRQDGRRSLTLTSPITHALREPRQEGGGLRYIKARLEEAAPEQWSLDAGPKNNNWVTNIELPDGGMV